MVSMSSTRRPHALVAVAAAGAALLAGAALAPASATGAAPDPATDRGRAETVRFATFNASLNRAAAGELVEDLSTPDDPQAAAVAEIVQREDPDVLLVNEFDYVPEHAAADLFRTNYLEVSQRGAPPVHYPYVYVAPSNTGVPSGHDLDNDGTVGGGNDAFGFGLFEGQYGMAVFSKHPIDTGAVRTFQTFRWADLPGALLPDDPATAAAADWYSPAELEDVRLSSKSHWDVPVQVGADADGHGGRTVHLLASHPTPPTFDGPEDRNGTRNHDEIRFWADYVSGGRAAAYVYDDEGRTGGLARGSSFVVAGDQNSDPVDGDSVPGAIQQLLEHPRVSDPRPASRGAREASSLQAGANLEHGGDPRFDTADFNDDPQPGNLRADYVLPSRDLRVQDAGVFWPVQANPLSRLTGTFPFPSSDHRSVWVDVQVRSR